MTDNKQTKFSEDVFTNNVLKFSGKWRDYQQRILDDLNFHLMDNKIHVVAAPGAGKTTLGIEVIARLNKPVLILAPTITIRNQWKQRIIDSFLQVDKDIVISCDIKNPKYITIITYQALLAAFCGTKNDEDEIDEIEEDIDDEKITANKRFQASKADSVISALKSKNIQLLCYDEAHHLRKEWWRALDYLVSNLEPKQTIALTATPPYDAETREWERYEELCGPIDELISIPELVLNGDLCPHQDFIHFSTIRHHENENYKKHLININNYLKNLLNNSELKEVVLKKLSEYSEEEILDDPKLYISACSYLKAAKENVPDSILNLFDASYGEIPAFNFEYQKLFLTYLFNSKETFVKEKEIKLINTLIKEARANGIIQGKTVYLNDSPKLKRQIANSIGKIDSIKKIVDIEVNSLKNDLRMVILADYIKLDNMDASELGVIPIWQTLKDRDDVMLAVLCGSLILLPKALKETFENYLHKMNLADFISSVPFDRDSNFIKIISKGNKKNSTVELITKMFIDGHINIITGTQALLGEGWDAPCINSLILSSTVSSYMLSNQMRGRAIRVDKNNPNKVSNIWHLASIKVSTLKEAFLEGIAPSASEKREPLVDLSDYEQLVSRFKGFQAPSNRSSSIESGIERILPLEFSQKIKSMQIKEQDFLNLNRAMEFSAKNRNYIKNKWLNGNVKEFDAPIKSLKDGILSEISTKEFRYNGYWSIFTTWLVVWGLFVCCVVEQFLAYRLYKEAYILFVLSLACFIIAILKPTIKYLRCSSPEKIMRQIGIVFLETLSAIGEIKENLKTVSIKSTIDPDDKSVFFSVSNLTIEENNLLVKSILEFLNPIENPRYLFIRKDTIAKIVKTTDYHALPMVIANKKENVKIFEYLWEKYIGKCETVYTRNYAGRKILLKARKKAFSELNRSKKAKRLSRFE